MRIQPAVPGVVATSPTDRLLALATFLDATADQHPWGQPPWIIRVVEPLAAADEVGVDLGIKLLAHGISPAEHLFGFVAPPRWQVLGVVAEGVAHQLSQPASHERSRLADQTPVGSHVHPTTRRSDLPPAGPADHAAELCGPKAPARDGHRPPTTGTHDPTGPSRVRVVHLVDRTGASASVCRHRGGPVVSATATGLDSDDHRDTTGRVDEACRRALGLPTPAPAGDTAQLWAVVWLDRVVARAASADPSSPRPSWSEVAALHPALELLAATGAGEQSLTQSQFGRVVSVLADATPWSELRARCAAGTWRVPDLDPTVASWMDDGMFSRWVLDCYPHHTDLVAAVSDLLSPAVTRTIEAALRRAGLDPYGTHPHDPTPFRWPACDRPRGEQ